MSFSLISWALKQLLPTLQQHVLIHIADCADDEGKCWPSVGMLVRRTSASERAVHYAIAGLQKSGHLVIEYREGRSSLYRIPLHLVHPCTTCTPAPGAPTPAPGAPPPLHLVHPEPITLTYQEPSRARARVNGAHAPAPEKKEAPEWLKAIALQRGLKL